ncbi:MAG TPA: TonB-dependent receptor [Acidocella sp.]|nr:TonB-dependent receptor [Acidocella sp.]
MRYASCAMRVALCATTALTFAAGLAHAQTASGSNQLNLGSVVSSASTGGGNGAGSGNAKPSMTGTLAQAQKYKKLAPNVVSIQPKSQMQKHPDLNLADAFGRISGVTVTYDSGAGQLINIRGLNPDLNNTTFGGIKLTGNSATSGGRGVDLAGFPPGLFGGLEVVKSPTPDMDATGLGGTATMEPITLPANGKPLADIDLAGGEETLRHTGVFQGSIALGDRFNIPGVRSFQNSKPFSVLFNYADSRDARGIDDFEETYDPNTFSPSNKTNDLATANTRILDKHTIRQGIFTQFGFDPSADTGVDFRFLKSDYDVTTLKDGVSYSNLNSTTLNSAGDYVASKAKTTYAYTNEEAKATNYVVAMDGHTVIADKVKVKGSVSYTDGNDVAPYSYSASFAGPTTLVNYNVSDPSARTIATPNENPGNAALYNKLTSASNKPAHTNDQAWAFNLDNSVANSILGNVGTAKFGGEFRTETEGSKSAASEWLGTNNISLAEVSGPSPSIGFYNNLYVIPGLPSYSTLNGLAPLSGAPQVSAEEQANLKSYQHNNENIYAAYAMETMQFGKMEVLAGLRMEDTNGTYEAYGQNTKGQITPGSPLNTNKQDYINFFPSLQLKYDATNRLQFRAAYSTAIARPGFDQISAADSVSIGGALNGENLVTTGNPNLKPTYGRSIDLVASYYGPYATMLSADAFYKMFDNYIFQSNSYGTYMGQPAEFSTYENEAGAFARGLELDVQQPLNFLPGPLSGLRVDGNISFTDSRGHSDGAQFKAYQLPDTSPIAANGELDYNYGRFGADVSVNYVGESLDSVTNPVSAHYADLNPRDADTFAASRTQVDANVTYAFTPRVTLYAQGRNLTNAPLTFTQGSSSQFPVHREFYDADWLVGVRLKLGG